MRVAMNDRRLALCVPSLSNGGAERAMAVLASECAELGWDVDMVLLNGQDADYADELSSRVRVVDLHQRHARTSVFALMQYLRQNQPVALFSTLAHMNCAVVVAARLAFVGARLVLREASSASAYDDIMRLLVAALYPGARTVVAVSDGVKADLVRETRLPADRICVIRNPVDVNHVRQLAREELATSLPVDDTLVILGVGRLEPVKDFSTLLRAFACLRATRRCRLVILGRGSQLMNLQQLADDLGIAIDVAFPGFVENPYAWMARSKVFVLSSVHEGCPNVLLEALTCGCSVVATDAPGDARFLLRNGMLGRLVPVGDWRSMARAIESALDEDQTSTKAAVVEEWLQKFEPRVAAIAYLRAAGLSPKPHG